MSNFFRLRAQTRLFITSVGLTALTLGGLLISFSIQQTRREQVNNYFTNLPLSFEENHGQADDQIQFISRGKDYTLYLSPTKAWMELHKKKEANISRSMIGLKLVDASPSTKIEGLDPLPGKSNYFIGNDRREWRTDIPNYSRVRYHEVYAGVSLVFYGSQQQLEYDFIVAPHADPHQIKLRFGGVEEMKIEDTGDLLINAGDEKVRMRKPLVYQETGGERRRIIGDYLIDDYDQVSFAIGSYDVSKPLIIDPVVDYSTFYGGSGTDIGYGITLDQQGNIYVTGQTSSLNFPTKNPFDPMLEGASDAFVMKLNSTGSMVIFASYIGGRNPGDRGWAIAVDRAGNVYFTGETNSLNFPVVNAAQPTLRGNVDAFATKLNIEGNFILYSTYLGGSLLDSSYSIALDRFDNAYLTGRTDSSNFPVRNALQASLHGQSDAFVTRLDAGGAIVFSTYLGGEPATVTGRDEEAGYGIALDSLQNAYITGFTTSAGFPTVNAFQPVFGGVEDGFVTKITGEGSAIIYSTFLGGTRADNCRSITVDSFGSAYVTGYTLSSDFPTSNALQPDYRGSADAFVTKLSVSGKALVYSTYLGGTGDENTGSISEILPSCAIAVDNFGNAYVTGKTGSEDFPVVRGVQSTLRGDTDAFVAKLDAAGSALIYSTYIGSSFTGITGFEERGLGIAVNNIGTAYVTGQVLKSDFPTMAPLQNSYGGGVSDAFIIKISTPDIVTISPVSAASFFGAAYAPESILAAFGTNLASGVSSANTLPLPTTLLGTSVTVKDNTGTERLAPLFFVSPNQVNFQIPQETVTGQATITISNISQNNSVSATVRIEKVAPGLFAANANGQGVPAAFVLRVKEGGNQSIEQAAQLNNQGRFVPLPISLGPESDQVFLILFGTGVRNRSSLSNIIAQIGGIDSQVFYAGPQGDFVGEDQVNILLPRSLAGRGEVVVTLTVDGMIANAVSINIQ